MTDTIIALWCLTAALLIAILFAAVALLLDIAESNEIIRRRDHDDEGTGRARSDSRA